MESIETLNTRLIEYFGTDTVTGQPIFRIVWSNDQLEKRLVWESDLGVQFTHPRVMEVKKYSYLNNVFVLERLVAVPAINQVELLEHKLSYEPLWSYARNDGTPVPPIWEATKFIIDTFYAALGKSSLRKYTDKEENITEEGRQARIDRIQDELFGDESGLLGKTVPSVGEGIVVPQSYKKETVN